MGARRLPDALVGVGATCARRAGASGWPQVREGAVGAVRLFGVVPVPARIVRVNPGESWAWQIGLVTMDHVVDRAAR